MPQSLSKMYVHIVFHTKTDHTIIRNQDKPDLYAYIGSIINDNGSIPIIMNGTDNHIHILCILSKNISLAKLTEEIKRNSSRWMTKYDAYYKKFAWQGGYAGFSVSPSLVDNTKEYIENQEAHHKKVTYKEELMALLKKHDIEYNEEYLFRD